MATLNENLEANWKKVARLFVGHDGRDVRPTLWHWTLRGIITKSGPFALDALTASAVYPSAYTAWVSGMLAGPEPTPTSIGILLRKIGCRAWRPDRCKLWIVRNDDGVRLKGGAYWLRRAKNVEHGGNPAWEPDPLYTKKNHDLYHGATAQVAKLYQCGAKRSDALAELSRPWL